MNDIKKRTTQSAIIAAILMSATLVVGGGGARTSVASAASSSASVDNNNKDSNSGSSSVGCFTTFLKKEEIGLLLNNLWGVSTIADVSEQLDNGQQNPDLVLKNLLQMPIEQSRLNELIMCLQDTGIVFA